MGAVGQKVHRTAWKKSSLQKNFPDNSSEETGDSGFKGSKGRVRDNIGFQGRWADQRRKLSRGLGSKE